MQKLLCVKEEG